jgi:hypothetical protein
MKQWIAKLQGLVRRRARKETILPCVYSVAEENVRVDVLEHVLPCGHNAYSIYGEYYVEEFGKWVNIIDLRDFNAERAFWLLRKAMVFLAALDHGLIEGHRKIGGPCELPTITLWGRRFYIDERLKELRNVENPHDRVELRAA